MVEFENVWNYVSNDWGKSLKFFALAGLMILIPVVGPLAFSGLMIKVISLALKNSKEVPDPFNDFSDNIVHGLKVLVLNLVMGLISIALIIPFILGSFADFYSASLLSEPEIIGVYLRIMGSIIAPLIIVVLINIILTPGLLCNYAKKQKFSALFDFKTALSVVFNNFGKFLKMILIYLGYTIIVIIISSILSITFIGMILTPPIMGLITGKIYGDWFREVSKQ